jgi:hypothetical protein
MQGQRFLMACLAVVRDIDDADVPDTIALPQNSAAAT